MISLSRIYTGIIALLLPILLLSQGNSGDHSGLFECIEKGGNSREKVDCYVELARIYRQINKDSSLLFADEAYVISKRISYPEGMADALYRRGQTLDYMGMYIDAIKAVESSLAIADSIKDSTRMAKAYYKIATLKNDFGEMEQAGEYLLKALSIYKTRQDTIALVAIYNGLGNYYNDISQLDSAAIYYHKAINYAEATGRTAPLGRIMGNLGKVYDYMEDYENARKYLLLALSYDLGNNDINNLGYTYSRLGGVELEMHNFPEAMRYYEQADSSFRKAGDLNGIYEVSVNRSIVYKLQGKYDQALSLLQEALRFYRSQGYTDGMLAIWIHMSEVYSEKGLERLTVAYYDSCQILALQTNNNERLLGIYNEMYSFYLESGNPKQALAAHLKYTSLKDSIYNLEKTALINDLLLRYEKEKDQLRILTLENENLQKARQRNLLLMLIGSIVVLGVLLILFLLFKHRKNKLIADQQIMQLEEEKKHMAARFLVEGEERERKRMAMELHDNLGVLLSATKMKFSEIRDKTPENKNLLEKASKYLEQASSDVRKISHNLMPGLLTKLGLFEALEDLFESLDEPDKLEAYFDVVGPKNRLPENKEIMIYRIIQEMVNNSLKHAEADKIDLTVIVQPDELNISFSDNGKGFDVNEVLKKKTLGLQNIQSRVKFLDGILNIDSNGNGAVYRICIPLESGECKPSS